MIMLTGADPVCRADRYPKFENSKMVWKLELPQIEYTYVQN